MSRSATTHSPGATLSSGWGWVVLGLVAVGLAVGAGAAVRVIVAGPKRERLLRQLANKWAAVFKIPATYIAAIIRRESNWRPGAVNRNARAMRRGGAWGPMQVTGNTARGIAKALQASRIDSTIGETLARWKGDPSVLIRDADLAVMFGTYYLDELYEEFGDFRLVAAAYHQGPGKVRKMIAAKKPIPSGLPFFGRGYVTRAITYYNEEKAKAA